MTMSPKWPISLCVKWDFKLYSLTNGHFPGLPKVSKELFEGCWNQLPFPMPNQRYQSIKALKATSEIHTIDTIMNLISNKIITHLINY